MLAACGRKGKNTLSDPNIPSVDQLAETRRTHWHQDGNALLTAEAVLPWIERCGLVLFAPRGQQFPAPAPSLVEATLGAPNGSPSIAEREAARSLTQRLVAEGKVLPLNLLGASGTTADEPDFLVSVAVFPYLFTLRGDKAWKQLPSAGGPFKVSPLAVNTYTLLSESGPRSVPDLVTELGKGLTETAVLRALSELWQHLRVFPVGQPDSTTLWELASVRFTKAIKAGANAGQPSALSALITLYLGQAVLTTEDEVEVFLSPLAPRSRVRDVVHALTAAREIETLVVEGKHCFYVDGDLPTFAPAAVENASAVQPEPAKVEGEGRIKKFAGAARRPVAGGARSFSSDRERRPFAGKRDGPRPGSKLPSRKPIFNRPWEEERQARSPRSDAPEAGDSETPQFQDLDLDAGAEATTRPAAPASRDDRPKKPFGAGKKPFSGGKPPFGGRGGPRPFADRAGRSAPSSGGDRAAGRPPFRKERDGDSRVGGGDRPAYSRPREPKEAGFAGRERPPFRADRDGSAPKRTFAKRGFSPDSGPGPGPRGPERSDDRRGPAKRFGPPTGDRPFRPRPEEGSDSRPPRREFGGSKRPEGDGKSRAYGPSSGTSRDARGPRPARADAGPPAKRFGAGPGGPKRSFSSRPSSGAGDRPSGKRPFAGNRPFAGKPGDGQRAAVPFDKFKGGNKPWGKRPPARKIKPEEDKA